ncbi:FimD/PapC N-terminal domain-containing protein, partial [Proteus mirabilis]
LVLNGQKKLLTDFTFKDNGTPRAQPCFTPKILMQIGLKAEAIQAATGKDSAVENAEETCVELQHAFTGASWDFDAGTQE